MKASLFPYASWLFAIVFIICGFPAAAQNLALNKAALASSETSSGRAAGKAFDGDGTTRWESASSDLQYVIVDLGSVQTIDRIRLTWEGAYGKNFTLDVSAVTAAPTTGWANVLSGSWTTLKTVTGNTSTANEYPSLAGSGRYVRMNGTARATSYGYSLFEFEVFNYSNSTANNLANGKPGTALSTQGGYPASQAFDNNNNTRWGSDYTDNQWLYVDLQAIALVSRIYLIWEAAYGKNYRLEVSNDAINWTTVYTTPADNSLYYNEITLAVPTEARYVRLYGVTRGTGFGFSLYEFQVYGALTAKSINPLPVTLTAFTAAPQGLGVTVRWATATEVNSAGYEVQRSADGAAFTTLTTVPGAGNSQTVRQYYYLDAQPLTTASYYRLRQLDQDGRATFGPVVVVQPPAAPGACLRAYPNPTADQATLTWTAGAAATGRWTLFTSTGQVVHTEAISSEAGANAQVISLQPYAAGSYCLVLESAGQVLGRLRVQRQ